MYATLRFSFLHLDITEAVKVRRPPSGLDVSESLVSESLVSAGSYPSAQRGQSLFPRLGTGSSGRRTLRRHNLVLQSQCLTRVEQD